MAVASSTLTISALESALMRSEFRLKKADAKATVPFLDREVGAMETLEAEQVTLVALKAAYDAEKQRLIASVTPAPSSSPFAHPTPEQLWHLAAHSPGEFANCARFVFVPKKMLLKKVAWAHELEECIKAGGHGTLCINCCLGYPVSSIEDGWLIGPSGDRTSILFDKVAKALVLCDVAADGGYFFNLTGINMLEVEDHEGNDVGTQYIHHITPAGKMAFRKVNVDEYEDHYENGWVDDMINSGQLVLVGGS